MRRRRAFILLVRQFHLPLFGIFLSLSSFPNNNNNQIISIHRVTSFLPPCGLFPHFHNHQQSATNSHNSNQTSPTDSSHNNLSSSSAAADSAHLFRQTESPHKKEMSTIIINTPIIINSNPLTSFIQQGPTANQLVVIVLQSIRHTPLRYCGR